MQSGDLYPKVDPVQGYTDPAAVITSSQQNVEAYKDEDDAIEKAINFTHGKQWDAAVEAERESWGLPSMVADRTLGVYKTLDGFARKNKVNVQFSPKGNDDYDGAKLRNTVFTSVRTTTGLHQRQAEAYGLAAIAGRSYLYIYPTLNIRGEIEPKLHVPMAFECYPDCNSKDPIKMKDAQFIDLRLFMSIQTILDELGDVISPEQYELILGWNAQSSVERQIVRNQAVDRSGMSRLHRNGQPLVIKRTYKVKRKSRYLMDPETGDSKSFNPEDVEADPFLAAMDQDPGMVNQLGFLVDEKAEEWIWTCILIPAIDPDQFFLNERSDFQPVDVMDNTKFWPIVSLPHLYVAGKSISAIIPILKIQEYRNLILSAFIHHVQTTANGGMGYEQDAFADPDEEKKFLTKRARAGISIKFKPPGADKREAKDKVFVLPKGEWAFADGGQILEQIFESIITDVSGAKPVIQGEAQKGSPASLYKQQIEQADNNMMGTSDLYKEFQFVVADVINSFTSQFFTEERMLEIDGPDGNPAHAFINQQTAAGIVNDITHGLYAVHKTEAPVTETARRQRLADNLEITKALLETGLPAFLLDFESLYENMDIPQERKDKYLSWLDQWRTLNGIQFVAATESDAIQQQAAGSQAQASNAVNQALASGGTGMAPQAPQGAPAMAGAQPGRSPQGAPAY